VSAVAIVESCSPASQAVVNYETREGFEQAAGQPTPVANRRNSPFCRHERDGDVR